MKKTLFRTLLENLSGIVIWGSTLLIMIYYDDIIGYKVKTEDKYFIAMLGIFIPVVTIYAFLVSYLIEKLIDSIYNKTHSKNRSNRGSGIYIIKLLLPFFLSAFCTNILALIFELTLKENLLILFFIGFVLYVLFLSAIGFLTKIYRR